MTEFEDIIIPILTVLMGLMVSISIISNIICICVIRITNFTSVRRDLLLSLSVADLAVGIFSGVPVLASAIAGDWPFPQWFCWIQAFCAVQFNVTSLLCVLALNIDRYIAIPKPLLYSSIATYRRAVIVVATCWIIAAIWIFFDAFLAGKGATYSQEYFSCSFNSQKEVDWHRLVTVALYLCIPVMFSIILSYKIWKIAKYHSLQITKLSNITKQQPKVKVKATFILILMNVCFFIAWCPWVVASVVEGVLLRSLSPSAGLFVVLTTMFHVCTNIFVYYCNNKSFRESVKTLFNLNQNNKSTIVRYQVNQRTELNACA